MINLLNYIKNSNVSLEKLSQKTGILPDKLKDITSGTVEPSIVDIRKISKALKVSIDFLLSGSTQFQEIDFLFRKNINYEGQQQIAEKCSYVIGNSLELLSNNYIPKLSVLGRPLNFTNNFDDSVVLANEFRAKYFNADYYSPIVKLPSILENELNCIIYVMELGPKVEGASAIINNVPFIFLSERFPPRMLFTLAHELAHILVHHDNGEDFALIDGEGSNNDDNRKSEESFAHYFASALLLPVEGVSTTLKKVREHLKLGNSGMNDIEILYLSRIYGVSFEVAASRCEQLGITPKGTAKSLYTVLVEKYGSPEKRAESLGLPPRVKIEFPKVSANLIHSAIRKINSGEVSLGKASEILSLPISEILSANTTQN